MLKGVLCSPLTETQTDRHESENIGHPFRIQKTIPSTYHQGAVQLDHNDRKYDFMRRKISDILRYRLLTALQSGALSLNFPSYIL